MHVASGTLTGLRRQEPVRLGPVRLQQVDTATTTAAAAATPLSYWAAGHELPGWCVQAAAVCIGRLAHHLSLAPDGGAAGSCCPRTLGAPCC